ncbi:hypothetical protein [Polaromonas sp. JS666]|uniref:hypothetical protein n=1 Tax=Polaromonas sp. (strain JS666 / ATCC BAA-500) TaxID=296591 RepID=UPI00059EA091|nr:hypothetical protein [Polaromonas sp. JS666]
MTLSKVKSDWHAACHRRGLLRPDAANLSPFLEGLDVAWLQALEAALCRCANGTEQGGDFAFLNWAAKSTAPTVFGVLSEVGLSCTATELFLAGVSLMDRGWDMSARLVGLKDKPDDIEALRDALVQHQAQPEVAATPPASAGPDRARHVEGSPLPYGATRQPASVPPRQNHGADVGDGEEEIDTSPPAQGERTRLKLYGRAAAHTVEIGPHRRGEDFLGSHVVTFESAKAQPGGTYDWARKLTFQLTPEEMPAAIAVLMNIQPSVRFEYHGKARDKFLELRWQGSGLAVATGQKSLHWVVPVQSAAVYYLLCLFCRAMVHGQPGMNMTDVMAMVGALPGRDPVPPVSA